MIGAISSALSGLFVSSKRVEAAAGNIANMSSSGYTPVTTVQTTGQNGEAQATNVLRPEGSEVDLAEEAVNLKLAEITYKANLSVLKTIADMEEETGRLFDKKV